MIEKLNFIGRRNKKLSLFLLIVSLLVFLSTLFLLQGYRIMFTSFSQLILNNVFEFKHMVVCIPLFTPLVLLLPKSKKLNIYVVFTVVGLITIFSRLLLLSPVADITKLFLSSLLIGSFGVMMAIVINLLYIKKQFSPVIRSIYIYMAFSIAILVDLFLRTMGSSYDISMYGFPPFYSILSPIIITLFLLFLFVVGLLEFIHLNQDIKNYELSKTVKMPKFFWLSSVIFGGILFISTNFIFFPSIVANKLGLNYNITAFITCFALTIAILYGLHIDRLKKLVSLERGPIFFFFVRIATLYDVLYAHSFLAYISLGILILLLMYDMFLHIHYVIKHKINLPVMASYICIVILVATSLSALFLGTVSPLSFIFNDIVAEKFQFLYFLVFALIGLSSTIKVFINNRTNIIIKNYLPQGRSLQFVHSIFLTLFVLILLQAASNNTTRYLGKDNLHGAAQNKMVKVFSYNAQLSNSKKLIGNELRLINFILKNSPDIIALQDTGIAHVIAGNQNVIELLAKLIGFKQFTLPQANLRTNKDNFVTLLTGYRVVKRDLLHYLPFTIDHKFVQVEEDYRIAHYVLELEDVYKRINVLNIMLSEDVNQHHKYLRAEIQKISKTGAIIVTLNSFRENNQILLDSWADIFPNLCKNKNNFILTTEDLKISNCSMFKDIHSLSINNGPLLAEIGPIV